MSDTAAKVTEDRDFALVERVDHQGIVTHANLALSLSLKVDTSLPFDHAVPILSARHAQGSTFEDVSLVASDGPRASGQEVVVDSVAPSTVDVLLFNGDRLWVVPVTLLGRGGQRTPTAPPFCYKLQKQHGDDTRKELSQSSLAQHRTDHAERKKAKQAWREFGKYACEAFTSYIEAEVDYSKNKNKKKAEAERLRVSGSGALPHTSGAGSAEQVATLSSLPEESRESVHDGPHNDASASAGHVDPATAPSPAALRDPHPRGDTPPALVHALHVYQGQGAGQLEVLAAPQRASGAPARPSTPSATSQAEDALVRMTIHDSGAYDAQSSVGGRAPPSSEGDASASQPRSHRRPTHRDRMRIRKEGLARDAARREAAAALELALAALEPTGSEEGGSSAASQVGEVAPPDLPAPETLEAGQGAATNHSSASSSASTDSKKKDTKIAQVAALLRQAVQRAFNPEGGARGSQGGGSSRHSEGGAGPVDTLEQGTGRESPSGRMPVSAGGYWPRAGSSGGGAGPAGSTMPRSPYDSFGSRAFAAKPRGSGPPGMFSSARSVSSSVQSGSLGGWGHMAAGPHSQGHRPTGSGYTPSYTSKRSGQEGSSVAPLWAPDHPHHAHMQHGLLDGSMGAHMLAPHSLGAAPQGYPQGYPAHQHGYGIPMPPAAIQQPGIGYGPAGSLLAPGQSGYALPHVVGGVTAGPAYVMQQQSAPSHSNMTYLAVDNNTRQVHVLQGPGASGVSPPSRGMAPVPQHAIHPHHMPMGMQSMPMVQGSMMPQYQGVQPIGQQQPVFVHLMPSQ